MCLRHTKYYSRITPRPHSVTSSQLSLVFKRTVNSTTHLILIQCVCFADSRRLSLIKLDGAMFSSMEAETASLLLPLALT